MEEGKTEDAGTNKAGDEETFLVVAAADESERSSSRNTGDESCASYHLEKDDACNTSIQSLLALVTHTQLFYAYFYHHLEEMALISHAIYGSDSNITLYDKSLVRSSQRVWITITRFLAKCFFGCQINV